MRVDGLAVLDHSKQVHSDGAIPELELVEILLGDLEPVPVLETLDGHVLYNVLDQHVGVLVLEQVLKMLVLQLTHHSPVFLSLHALAPLLPSDFSFGKPLRHLVRLQTFQQWFAKE